MTQYPKISIAIVTYNHEKYIAEALQSVLDQETNFFFEIVIGDDCSTDNTRAIVTRMVKDSPHKVLLLFYDQKVGIFNNYLNVYSQCSGEYIAHLDGDDVMLPGKLQKQVDFLDTHPNCVMCGHSVEIIDAQSKKIGIRSHAPGIYDIEYLVQHGCVIFHCSKMFRKNAIPPEGFCNSRRRIGDFIWHLQNLQFGKLGYLKEVLGKYRRHSQGLSQLNGSPENIQEALSDELYAIDWAQAHGVSEAICQLGASRIYFYVAAAYLKQKGYAHFQEYLEKAYLYTRTFFGGKVIWFFRKHPIFLLFILRLYLRYLQ